MREANANGVWSMTQDETVVYEFISGCISYYFSEKITSLMMTRVQAFACRKYFQEKFRYGVKYSKTNIIW